MELKFYNLNKLFTSNPIRDVQPKRVVDKKKLKLPHQKTNFSV